MKAEDPNNRRKQRSGSGGAAARSERGQEYLFPRRYSQPAEKVVKAEVPNNQQKRRSGSGGAGVKFPTISKSDGAAAAERKRGQSGAKSTSSYGVTDSLLRRL